jgi:hypothetical protein
MHQIPNWPHKVYVSRFKESHAEWCRMHVPDNSWSWWLEIDPTTCEDLTVFGFEDLELATQFALCF